MTVLLAALAFAGPHADHVEQFGHIEPVYQRPRPAALPAVTNGPDRIVYGYEAYWNADLNAIPWDDISHLAIFDSGVDTSGNLTDVGRFDRAIDAVAIAEAYDVRIHLCVTNFTTSELATLLASSTARQRLIDQLVVQVERTGAHGVNIDFEGMPSSQRANMVTFIRDLDAAVEDVVMATPAVDWSGAWDYAALSQYGHLFIMGYGYHWSGSDNAGPVDPLFGGSPWGPYSLDWTAQDYLGKNVPGDRIILGVPLYGFEWPVSGSGFPTAATGSGSAVVFRNAWTTASSAPGGYDPVTLSHYYNSGGEQTWYGTTETVQQRIQYADAEGLGGFGFWAMHYTGTDADFWGMIHDETAAPLVDDPEDPVDDPGEGGEGDTAWVANAGTAFLAYPGDTAIIGSEGSLVPQAGAQYRWTQTDGPPVGLAGADTAEVQFLVAEPGVVVLQLEVGDGTLWSAPDSTHIIVLDRGIGRDFKGCSTVPGSLPWLSLLALAGLVRRRSHA